MHLHDNFVPSLPGGAYRYLVQQTVSLENGQTYHYYHSQAFHVLAPRFAIDESEVQAYFPPRGGVGAYNDILPHLVLRSRGLPWERLPWAPENGQSPVVPWMALLVLGAEEEMNKAAVKTVTIADLLSPGATQPLRSRTEEGRVLYLPELDAVVDDPKTPVRVLDIDPELFRRVCPLPDEARWLAHVRHADTSDKVPVKMAADGEFAVVVANRFPPPGANSAYLVSLEGWKALFPRPGPTFATGARARLIVLASWSFGNEAGGHDTFDGLATRVVGEASQQRGGHTSSFGVSLPESGAGTDADRYVRGALGHGYVPVVYRPARSPETFAWYRGPCAPVPRKEFKSGDVHHPDAALVFDAETGIFDVSYAAAWELGRLLALASPAFSGGLRAFVESAQNAAEVARQIDQFVADHRSLIATPGAVPTDGVGAGTNPVAMTLELVEWIARLYLLYPVPFHYLVPDPRLLPQDSFRFFHLDKNWVDLLVEGALSVAVRCKADRCLTDRKSLRDSLSAIITQYRRKLQGKPPLGDPRAAGFLDAPQTGFLLRSALVSGWPGLEVVVETDESNVPDGSSVLRMDNPTEGVLFCLVRGRLKKVTLKEPREGLRFGVHSEEQGRYVEKPDGAKVTLGKAMFRNPRGDGPLENDGVLKIGNLRAGLAGRDTDFGPAGFAVSMIRQPSEQTILWTSSPNP